MALHDYPWPLHSPSIIPELLLHHSPFTVPLYILLMWFHCGSDATSMYFQHHSSAISKQCWFPKNPRIFFFEPPEDGSYVNRFPSKRARLLVMNENDFVQGDCSLLSIEIRKKLAEVRAVQCGKFHVWNCCSRTVNSVIFRNYCCFSLMGPFK